MDYKFNFNVVFDNIGTYLKALGIGLLIAVIALSCAMILGFILALGATSQSKFLQKFERCYVAIFRNVPLLIFVYIIYFGLPDIGIIMNKYVAFTFTLSIYGASYMAEVFRAGLESIKKGIIEAGQAIGLSHFQIMMKIKLPIMFRAVIPSLGNYLISLFKDTALAAAIAIPEITYVAKTLNVKSFRTFEVWIAAAVLYIATSYGMAFILQIMEKKLKVQ